MEGIFLGHAEIFRQIMVRPTAIGKNLELVFNLRAGMMAVSVEENSETNMIMLGIWLLQRFFLVVMTLGMFPSDQTLRKT